MAVSASRQTQTAAHGRPSGVYLLRVSGCSAIFRWIFFGVSLGGVWFLLRVRNSCPVLSRKRSASLMSLTSTGAGKGSPETLSPCLTREARMISASLFFWAVFTCVPPGGLIAGRGSVALSGLGPLLSRVIGCGRAGTSRA